MLALVSLSKSYGERTLFADVSLNLNAARCYGLVGANGSGKSTLLRILAGEETASSGSVSIPRRCRLGLLRQDHFLSDAQPIIEVAMMGHREVFDAMHAKDELLARTDVEFDGDRFHELEEIIAKHDGYSLESKAATVLEGLGIPTAVHRQPLSTLSGGFKLRVLIAQALASDPDAILLDEPTNHLDILSIRWLEKFLNEFKGLSVVVSHDHRFLDNACTDIIDVDYETMLHYPGNYTAFQAAKAEHRERKEAQIEKQEKEIQHHRDFIDRFKSKATKARQAQSKLKMLDRVVVERLPQSSRRHPTFRFNQRRPSGREVVKLDFVSKSFGPKKVLERVPLIAMRGDRIAIIGPNGIGKSTLLKIIMAELAPDSGSSTWGYEAWPGYFAQDARFSKATPNATVQSWLWDTAPTQTIGFIRSQLGLVLFSGDDAEKRVGALSGGEAARLTFARLSLEQPNVLVLDEPTNHLDLEAIEALVEGLASYDGTVLFVSHDRWFVQRLATRIFEITPNGVNDFPGTYDEYLAKAGDDHLDVSAALERQKSMAKGGDASGSRGAAAASSDAKPQQGSAPSPQGQPSGQPSGQDARKDDARLKQRRKELSARSEKISAELGTAERRLKEIEARYCQPKFFEETPRADVLKLDVEREQLARRVESLMGEWEQVEADIGKLG